MIENDRPLHSGNFLQNKRNNDGQRKLFGEADPSVSKCSFAVKKDGKSSLKLDTVLVLKHQSSHGTVFNTEFREGGIVAPFKRNVTIVRAVASTDLPENE